MAKRSIRWKEWGQEAFEEAWAGGRPLFLLIKDSWSEVPDEAPRLLAEDPVLSALLNASFVPVLSDADAHPEVLSRYGFGCVPCACVLHADGNVVIGFERMDLKELQSTLRGISQYAPRYKPRLAQGLGRYMVPFLPADDRYLERGTEMIEAIRQRLEGRLRPEGEDFGEVPGSSAIAPLRFLLEYAREAGDSDLCRKVIGSFHTLAHSELYDSTEGGFFSALRGPILRTDKRLLGNAGWLKFALLVSGETEGRFALPLARGILHYLQTHLLLPNGAFAAGQREDGAYYRLSSEERRHVPPPPANASVFAAPNAAAVGAFCAAWQVLGEGAYLDIALRTYAFLKDNLVAPDGSVAHVFEDGPRGIGYLDDQVALGSALLALYRSTLDRIYLDGVRESARNIVSFYGNPAGAGFLDVRVQPEASRVPRAPLLDPLQNARTAVFLARASAQLEDPALAAPAREILSALMEEESGDPTALGLVGSALIAILYPMSYYVAVTNGSEVHRTRVMERIRGFGRPFPMIFHREPSPGEQMQTLPRLTAHCAHQHEEILVP